MKRLHEKLISFLLVFVMSMICIFPTTMQVAAFSEDIGEITEAFDGDFFVVDENCKQDYQDIDRAAESVYNYYEENGVFPEKQKESNRKKRSTNEAIRTLSNYGVEISQGNLSVLLAQLGALIGMNGAMPICLFIAIVAGVYVGLEYEDYLDDIKANSKEIARKIAMYASLNAVRAGYINDVMEQNELIKENKKNSDAYFAVSIEHGSSFLGLNVEALITKKEAIKRLGKYEQKNVLSTSEKNAYTVAKKAHGINVVGNSSGVPRISEIDSIKGSLSKAAHLPHYHLHSNGAKLPHHSFFLP